LQSAGGASPKLLYVFTLLTPSSVHTARLLSSEAVTICLKPATTMHSSAQG
jgi:hypothetical protein